MLSGDGFGALHEWGSAAFLCVSALGAGFVSGAETVFFHGQMINASWLGILAGGALFAGFTGIVAHCARKTGAQNFGQIFRRSMGVYAGGTVWFLQLLSMAIMACLMLGSAADAASQLFQDRYAPWVGIISALIFAGIVSASRFRMNIMGMLLTVLLLAYLLTLLFAGRMPPETQLFAHTKAKLRDSAAMALLLGALYGCRSAAVTAGITAGFACRIRPLHTAAAAGVIFCLLTGIANAVVLSHPIKLMALARPFAAMYADLGRMGGAITAVLQWTAAGSTLGGMLFSMRTMMRGK